MKYISFALLFFVCALVGHNLRAQNNSITFANNTGNTLLYSVSAGPGGNIYHAGRYTDLDTIQHSLVVCSDNNGQILWSKQSANSLHLYSANEVVADNNYIYVAGLSWDSVAARSNGYVMRLDANGNVLWNIPVDSIVTGLAMLADGGVIAIGWGYACRIDSNGVMLWSNIISSTYSMWYTDAFTGSDGSVYCVGSGWPLPNGPPKGIITKLGADGSLKWTHTYSDLYVTYLTCGIANDSVLYVAGHSMPIVPQVSQFFIMKMDTSGTNIFYANGDVNGVYQSNTDDIALTPYGGVVVIGSCNYNYTPLIMEYYSGSLVFMRAMRYTGGPQGYETNSVTIDTNGVLNYCGSIGPGYNVDYYFGHTDNSWAIGCGFSSHQIYSGPHTITVGNLATTVTGDSIRTIVTDTLAPSSLINSVCSTGVGIQESQSDNLLIYPNPTNNRSTLMLEHSAIVGGQINVKDINGKTVLEVPISAGDKSVEITLEGLCAGMYFICLPDGTSIPVEKIDE